jgi:hypothetical protein
MHRGGSAVCATLVEECPTGPHAPKVHTDESILTHFGTADKATTLDVLRTAVFTDMPDGFESQTLS